jgi:hypothetical protein
MLDIDSFREKLYSMNHPAAELRGIKAKKARKFYPDAEHRGIL